MSRTFTMSDDDGWVQLCSPTCASPPPGRAQGRTPHSGAPGCSSSLRGACTRVYKRSHTCLHKSHAWDVRPHSGYLCAHTPRCNYADKLCMRCDATFCRPQLLIQPAMGRRFVMVGERHVSLAQLPMGCTLHTCKHARTHARTQTCMHARAPVAPTPACWRHEGHT